MSSSETTIVEHPNAIPWEKKVDVATKILALGNIRLAAEQAGVSLHTLRGWRKTDWWANLIEELKQEQRNEVTTRLGKIANTALEIVEDRLKNGEYILNMKTGDIIRKPVGLRDANQAVNNLLTQQTKLEQMNGKQVQVNDTVQDVLKQLASEFAKFNKKSKKADDIEFVEVVKES